MKRFWLVLLSLGLVMAFSASAFAVDVKVSGSYYAAGVYLDKLSLNEQTARDEGQSSAFYFQRLRVGTELVVSPGLSLITRFDAMERVYGASRSMPNGTGIAGNVATQDGSAGTVAENENIAFDYVYVKYATPIGTFQVGAQPGGTFGTVFGNSEEPRYRIKYISNDYNGFSWTATIEKLAENSYANTQNFVNERSSFSDADSDAYHLSAEYKAKNWAVGMLYTYLYDRSNRPDASWYYPTGVNANPFTTKRHQFDPYFTAVFGPVKLQAELIWQIGERDYENATPDKDINALAGWIDATATFGPVYVGGTIAYSEGDVDGNDDITGTIAGGRDWSPTLIMWNEDRARWIGTITSDVANDGFNAQFGNAWLYQLRVGVKPVEKLDVCFAASYARRDRVPDEFNKNLGWEFDLTGTYKITNNLSYMLGAGYLVTGDYFKGDGRTTPQPGVENNYMIINKLALTF